ncbi:MAG: lytic transglycosylase domain-containing protein [Bdellovibrionales bacterium]|nr:lytic transglycosylase domain-containing protein [Bdellovibrionales bacterium]
MLLWIFLQFSFANIPKNMEFADSSSTAYVFDLPITYNDKVKYWIQFYQNNGKKWFYRWLERGQVHMPELKQALANAGLPQDLAYLAMMESGLSSYATSHANAVGPWQFIKPTGERFKLQINWWLDERRNFAKSTQAAISYFKYLHKEFGSWYLVAAAYNTGEGRIRRMIKKYKTKDFWKLSQSQILMKETKDYIPKLIATMLIAKTPHLYGFRNIPMSKELESEPFYAPGGTNLNELADHLGVTRKAMYDLNPELITKEIPPHINGYLIRIPKGASKMVGLFINRKYNELAYTK